MKIVLIVLGVLFILLMIFSFVLYRQICYPKRQTREDQIKFNHEKGYDKGIERLERKPFEIKLRDNYIIHGDISLNKNSNKYIIIMHGHTSTREGITPMAIIFYELGYNVIRFDNRSHGDNIHNDCTMGKKEKYDLLEIINFVYDKFGKDIYLGIFGVSLGGAAVLQVLNLTQNLKFVVSDCPYGSMKKLGTDILKNRKIPLASMFIPFIDFYCQLLSKFSFKETSAINTIDTNKVPVLWMHGTSDTFIYPYQSQNLYDKATCFKKIKYIEGAIHARSVLKDRELYKSTIKEFLVDVGGFNEKDN